MYTAALRCLDSAFRAHLDFSDIAPRADPSCRSILFVFVLCRWLVTVIDGPSRGRSSLLQRVPLSGLVVVREAVLRDVRSSISAGPASHCPFYSEILYWDTCALRAISLPLNTSLVACHRCLPRLFPPSSVVAAPARLVRLLADVQHLLGRVRRNGRVLPFPFFSSFSFPLCVSALRVTWLLGVCRPAGPGRFSCHAACRRDSLSPSAF